MLEREKASRREGEWKRNLEEHPFVHRRKKRQDEGGDGYRERERERENNQLDGREREREREGKEMDTRARGERNSANG